MANVLVVFSTSLHDDLSARPGRSKLDKQKAARPRAALQLVLERLSREMEADGGTAHLRADLLEEPLHTRRLYEPGSLSILIANFRSLLPVPANSAFATAQPSGYIATFHYPRIGWTLLAAYLEHDRQPVLVFLRAMPEQEMANHLERIASRRATFDDLYRMAEEAALDAT